MDAVTHPEPLRLVDAHVHLWDTERLAYPWLRALPSLQRRFDVGDYAKATEGWRVDQLVFVQGECQPDQALDEVVFAEEQARVDARIGAIVAYAPLERGTALAPWLEELARSPLVRGVRRMTDDEPGLCLTAPFREAVRLLPEYDLSLDLSVKPGQWEETLGLVESCPHTQFVLDHLGKPAIRDRDFASCEAFLQRLAPMPNVVAKLSGLVTEADWHRWQPADLKPYVEVAVELFGFDRLLVGSDWPVVLLAGRLPDWLNTLTELLAAYPPDSVSRVFSENARRVYRLTP